MAGHTRYMKARGDTLEMTGEDGASRGPGRARASSSIAARPDGLRSRASAASATATRWRSAGALLTSAVRFDERIGRGRLIDGGDEHVAFMSLISDGYRVAHVPEAVVRHPAPATEPLPTREAMARPALVDRVPAVPLRISSRPIAATLRASLGQAAVRRTRRPARAAVRPRCRRSSCCRRLPEDAACIGARARSGRRRCRGPDAPRLASSRSADACRGSDSCRPTDAHVLASQARAGDRRRRLCRPRRRGGACAVAASPRPTSSCRVRVTATCGASSIAARPCAAARS